MFYKSVSAAKKRAALLSSWGHGIVQVVDVETDMLSREETRIMAVHNMKHTLATIKVIIRGGEREARAELYWKDESIWCRVSDTCEDYDTGTPCKLSGALVAIDKNWTCPDWDLRIV